MDYEGRIRVSGLDWLSMLLVIVGALNWGLVGLGMFVTGAGAIESWNLYQLYAAREARAETARTT